MVGLLDAFLKAEVKGVMNKKLYICSKWVNCQFWTMNGFNCAHSNPHIKSIDCEKSDFVCPKCAPVKQKEKT